MKREQEGRQMVMRRSLLMMLGALVGLTLTVGVSAMSTIDSREHLTFSGPVGLPGVTLAAGTYTFSIANPDGGRDVIVVRNRMNNQVCYLGFTMRAPRPNGLREDRSVVLAEAARGHVAPIVGWYPRGESSGHTFIYR